MSEPGENDWLAAQYVIGVLSAGERRLVQGRMRQDRSLAEAVLTWERRLAPLSLREPGLPPPQHALEGILASVAREAGKPQQASSVLPLRPEVVRLPSAPRGRRMMVGALAATVAALAVALGALVIDRSRTSDGPAVAVLDAASGNSAADEPSRVSGASFVAVLEPGSGVLTVRRVSATAPAGDRVHVLWLEAGADHTVVRLGVLDGEGISHIPVRGPGSERLANGRLVVTLEASVAWSSTPRGPVVALGRFPAPAR